MTDHPGLWDRQEGDRRKRDGIARAQQGADVEWEAAAHRAVLACCLSLPTFTTDDVWQRIPSHYQTPEARAMGPIMVAARKAGHVVETPDFRLSQRPACHRRPVRVWRSTRC